MQVNHAKIQRGTRLSYFIVQSPRSRRRSSVVRKLLETLQLQVDKSTVHREKGIHSSDITIPSSTLKVANISEVVNQNLD